MFTLSPRKRSSTQKCRQCKTRRQQRTEQKHRIAGHFISPPQRVCISLIIQHVFVYFCEQYIPAKQDIITRKRDYHPGSREDIHLIAQNRLGRKIGLTQQLVQNIAAFDFFKSPWNLSSLSATAFDRSSSRETKAVRSRII